MGADTAIEWCDFTFNPWWGCVKVSPGCAHCYADTFAKRVGQKVWGADAPRRFFGDKHWAEPLKWNREAEKAGERRRVFCASMADVFEDRPDLVEPRFRLFALIERTPNLDWLLLTKRPENILRLWPDPSGLVADLCAPNVWLGTTCEDQARADERIPQLMAAPAAVRFLSVEPLLGPVNLSPWLRYEACEDDPVSSRDGTWERRIDWVIVGGESGPGARVCEPEWVRKLVLQAKAGRVPCFVKQLGARQFDKRWEWKSYFSDPKGGDPSEWPADLRVREFPAPTVSP